MVRFSLRILPLLLALPFGLSLGCDLDHSVRHELLEFDEVDLQRLVVENGSGDITLIGDPDATSVSVVAEIHGHSTQARHDFVDGAIQLGTDCPASASNCSIDWTITVPSELPSAELSTGSGDIEVSEVATKLVLDTGSGDITLRELDSPTLDVETGSGDVEGHSLRCDDFAGTAGSGDLELHWASRPRRVAWESGSGDVDVSLPKGSYDLALDTGSGDVELSGIDDDPDADALLSLSTGSGDITITGR